MIQSPHCQSDSPRDEASRSASGPDGHRDHPAIVNGFARLFRGGLHAPQPTQHREVADAYRYTWSMGCQRSTWARLGTVESQQTPVSLGQHEGLGLLRNVGAFGGRRPTALPPFFVRTLPDPLIQPQPAQRGVIGQQHGLQRLTDTLEALSWGRPPSSSARPISRSSLRPRPSSWPG